jgi:chemotaxis protein methyltransferase CheR
MFFRKKSITKDIVEKSSIKEEFSTFGFNDILHYIKRDTGVDLFIKKNIIETRLKLFCEERNINSFKRLYDEIQYKNDLREELINLLTVNETYFFREEKQLQEAIDFAQSIDGSVSILCAPCASGEEVYTLSMLMSEKFGSLKKFNIVGIDINSEAIKKAKQGIYSSRSLHKLSDSLKNKYFSIEGDMYKVKKDLFPSVEFTQLNIFENSFINLGSFDIVFSRNMLIYFDDDFRVAAMERFAQLLKSNGRLFLGHADIVPQNSWLRKYGFGSNRYYSKS